MKPENWHPEVGEEVWWVPTFERKGLQMPPRRAMVFAHLPDGIVHIKFNGGAHRNVKLEALRRKTP